MKEFTVGANDAGQRLDKFLGKLLRDVPMGMIYKWIRKKRVKVNGKKQEISYMLCVGDRLELYINDEFFCGESAPVKKSLPINVVYEDENILIADKPSGISVHGEDGCLLERLHWYLFDKGEFNPSAENTFAPAFCNRIDKNTSGLVIAAKNAAALRIMNQKLKERQVDKYYIMAVEGKLNPSEGVIKGYTLKDEKTRKVTFSKEKMTGGKEAETYYRTLPDGLVEAKLITGRTHQIRASFAYLGHPLQGDVKYGAKKNGRADFQMLRAYKIEFNFTTPAGELDYLSGKVIKTDTNL